MDQITALFNGLFQGNNTLLILLGLFLFKDQILAWLQKKPVPAPAPVVVPSPVPGPAPIIVPPDHPLVDVFIKDILPILLPILVNVIKKQEPPK